MHKFVVDRPAFPGLYQISEGIPTKQDLFYNQLYENFMELYGQLRQGDKKFAFEINDCERSKNWVKYDSCKILFLKPIIGAMATFRYKGRSSIHLTAIDEWIAPQFLSRNEWNERTKANEMIALMKTVLSKDQLDDGLYRREMIYTILHRVNPDDFPWNESPFGKKAAEWYQYSKSQNDAKLREIFNLHVEQEVWIRDLPTVMEFCSGETRKTLLCSIVAAKNKYDGTLGYFPPTNPSSPISISAYVGDDRLYESFKANLDELLRIAAITDSVTELSGGFSKYFQTMARFDQDIAKADEGYLTTAIEKNGKRLVDNAKKLDKLVKEIKGKETTCLILDVFEAVTTVVVAVGIGVATGGAGFAVSAASMPAKFSAFTTGAVKAVQLADMGIASAKIARDYAFTLGEKKSNAKEFASATLVVEGAVNAIMYKLKENGAKIDNMKTIQKAVIDRTDFNSIQNEVVKFLTSYNNYEPGVDLTDLVGLNTKQEQMFESMEKTFSSAGFGCSYFVGAGARSRVRQAKAIWTSIYSLLNDIYGKQSEHISALAKVVRSRLDEAAAKKYLEPGINYNFEIIVGYMLSLRVAAQQVCDTFQFMNNDIPDGECNNIRNIVFLSEETRDKIFRLDTYLQKTLGQFSLGQLSSSRFAYIPVSSGSSIRAINWDDLIAGEITEFALLSSSIAKDLKWINYPEKIALLKSMEIFIPNNLVANSNDERDVRLNITAIQDSVVVNGNSNAQRYTIKSPVPYTTLAEYRVNVQRCDTGDGRQKEMTLYDKDASKYCITIDNGRFGNGLKQPLPVSMYSKFQIRLMDGYDKNSLPRPFGDTLKLLARLVFFNNPGGGIATASSATSTQPNTEHCGPGQYRRMQECVPCPPGSVPYAHGVYCISEEDAKKIGGMGITSAASVQAKPFASASDKETVDTKPKNAKKPNVFERLYNWVKPKKSEKEPYGKSQSRDEHHERKKPQWRP